MKNITLAIDEEILEREEKPDYTNILTEKQKIIRALLGDIEKLGGIYACSQSHLR
jgi:hypothetical protein